MENNRLEQLKKQYMSIPIPTELDGVIKQALASNMKKGKRKKYTWISGVAAAAALFVSGVNMSPGFAHAMSAVPGVAGLVKLVTFAEYHVDEAGFHADIKVPSITNMEDKGLISALNEKYAKENKELYHAFTREMEAMKKKGGAHLGIDGGYKVVTDTEQLLAIQRFVVKTQASGAETLQYDTIDKKNQVLITLPSLFKDERYIQVISENITEQMREQMKADPNKIYWVKGANVEGMSDTDTFRSIAKNQNFYINRNGNLVISFDEYDVAPGYMGTVEFEIPTQVIQPLLVSNTYVK